MTDGKGNKRSPQQIYKPGQAKAPAGKAPSEKNIAYSGMVAGSKAASHAFEHVDLNDMEDIPLDDPADETDYEVLTTADKTQSYVGQPDHPSKYPRKETDKERTERQYKEARDMAKDAGDGFVEVKGDKKSISSRNASADHRYKYED